MDKNLKGSDQHTFSVDYSRTIMRSIDNVFHNWYKFVTTYSQKRATEVGYDAYKTEGKFPLGYEENRDGVAVTIRNVFTSNEIGSIATKDRDAIQIWYCTVDGSIHTRRISDTGSIGEWSKLASSVDLKKLQDKITEVEEHQNLFNSIPENGVRATIEGEYGVNLLPYREMSRDPEFGVNGKVFYTKGEKRIDEGTMRNHTMYNRLRHNQDFSYRQRLLYSEHHEKETHAKATLKATSVGYELQFGGIPEGEIWQPVKTSKCTEYSYFRFDVGGHEAPTKCNFEIEAWYGDINPEGLDQQFVFKKYNGYELRAIQEMDSSNNPTTVLRDLYKHYTYGDKITRKVGLYNLKDHNDYISFKDSDGGDNKLLLLPIPEDCDPSTAVLMSNNLCDITADQDPQVKQDKPFFMRYIDTEDFPLYDRYGKPVLTPEGLHKTETKSCFVILLGKEYMSKWKEHLSNTQILYKLKTSVEEMLPTGGILFTTSSGDTVRSCMYKDITVEQGAIQFLNSPFGYPDQVIFNNQIAQVTLHHSIDETEKG